MSSSSFSKWPKSRNLKLCAHDAGGCANSGRTRRSSSSGSAPSRCRCVSVFGRDWTKLNRSGEAMGKGVKLTSEKNPPCRHPGHREGSMITFAHGNALGSFARLRMTGNGRCLVHPCDLCDPWLKNSALLEQLVGI